MEEEFVVKDLLNEERIRLGKQASRLVSVSIIIIDLIVLLLFFLYTTPWVKEKIVSYKIDLPQGYPSCEQEFLEWLTLAPNDAAKRKMELSFRDNLACFSYVVKATEGKRGFSYEGIGLSQKKEAYWYVKSFAFKPGYKIKVYRFDNQGNIWLTLSFDLLLFMPNLLFLIGIVTLLTVTFIDSFFFGSIANEAWLDKRLSAYKKHLSTLSMT